MITLLTILVGIGMAATLGVLLAGVAGISRRDPAKSNQLMRWRVILQFVTLLLFVILLSLIRH